jgi:hypothetical protein
MEKVNYAGWPNCIRLANPEMEVIATTDVGPRIIRCGFIGGQNLFKEIPETLGKTGGSEWNNYGGHRLWHAPEAMPRTYAPDNAPVPFAWNGTVLNLSPRTEATTGIRKEIEISLDRQSNRVRILHRLINENLWEVEVSPWCLSVMAAGGRAIIPQEPYTPHPEILTPVRTLSLWSYTLMTDPRWTWGSRYIQVRQDPAAEKPQKAGFRNSLGWAAYQLGPDLFLKRYPYEPGASYPDLGVNTEVFTNKEILEVETLGPLTRLAPQGHVELTEEWFLFRADVGESEDDLDRRLAPLLESSKVS